MADVKKIKLPDNSEYNIKDYRIPGVDTAPTSGSDNVITSGGIYAANYAGSDSNGGPALKTYGIPYGAVDSTSTATVITATVDNFPTELTNGVCAYIRNDVVASASGWTLNVNGTGALPVYGTNSDATRTTTVFNAASTYLFVYNSTRVSGGCWDIYYGYNSNDNTIGYNLRTNGASAPPAAQKYYRHRLLFTAANGQSLVPANTSTSTSTTAEKAVNQTKIDPFGVIFYYSTTAAVNAGASPSSSYLWMQYNGIALGYSFNRTGEALTMTTRDPVYLKCAPQSDGSAIMDEDNPIVQALPTTADGKIYIFLGFAESETAITLYYWHPVYYHDGTKIVIWTGKQDTLTFDTTPTENSTNPVTSGGIYNAITENEEVVAAALNDLNDRLDNIDIPTDNIQNYYTGLNSTSDVIDPKEGDIFYKVNENWTQIYPSLTTTSSISESTRTYNFGSGYVTRLKMTDISSEISSISYVNANNETVNFGDQFSSEIIFPVGIKSITLSNDTSEPPTAPSLYRNDTTYTYMEYYRGQWINRPVIISNINGFSSDDQIPTAKAVYDLNLNNQRVIVGGENDDTYTFEQNAYGSFYNDSIPEGTILQYGYPKYTSGETTEISNLDTGFWPSSTCKFLYWSPGGYSYVERINIMFYEAGTYNFVTNAPGNMDSSSEYAFSFTITDSDLNYLEDGYTQTSGEFTIRTVDNVYIEPGEYVYLYYTGDTPPNVKIASYKSTYIMHNGMWENYVFPRHGYVSRGSSDGFVDGGQVWEAIHPQILNTNYIFPNQMHKFGTVTGSNIWTLVTPIYDDIINHYFWTFETGATPPTITWPSGLIWPGGSPPALLPNKHYEISVLNNIVAWMEV